MVKIRDLRKNAVQELIKAGNDSPVADVDFIFTNLLGVGKTDLIIGEKTLDAFEAERFLQALERVKTGEPVQYAVGGCEFMSLWFEVNSDTLIPRSDTEILVEAIIERCRNSERLNIFEIGTGSGCISVSLAYYLPRARVTAVDISKGALDIARGNGDRLGVAERTKFLECDIMSRFPKFEILPNVVVSNPPYIPKADIDDLEKKVKDFEPMTALDGGADGLDFYRRIAGTVPLASCGVLAFEVGIGQAGQVAQIMEERFCNIEIVKDLSGIDRVVLGKLKG